MTMTEKDIALLKEAREYGYSRIETDEFMSKFDSEEAKRKAESISFASYMKEHCRED